MAQPTLMIWARDPGLLASGEELAGAGFRWVPAPCDERFMEELSRNLPDLLLVEIGERPEEDLWLLREISRNLPSICAVALLAEGSGEEECWETVRHGARGYLVRPREAGAMGKMLRQFIRRPYALDRNLAARILMVFEEISPGRMEGYERLLPEEERILLEAARGGTLAQVQREEHLSDKHLSALLGSVWQKLLINEEARTELALLKHAEEDEKEERPPPSEGPARAPAKERGLERDRAEAMGRGAVALKEAVEEERQAPKEGVKGMEVTRMREEQGVAEEINQLVIFRLGREEFAVIINQVQEIVRLLPVTALPKVPFFVEGIVNLRGNIVPIIDLRKKFGMESGERTKDTRIMVVNVEGNVIGMVVDSVSEVLRVARKAIEPAPPLVLTMDAEFIQGVVNLEERLIIFLDLKRVVTKDERKALQAIG